MAKRWSNWTKVQRDAAVGLLFVWFYEMRSDAEDGEYDCTCLPKDPCPLHRVHKFLREVGVKGIGRPPSRKRLQGYERPVRS